MTSELLLKERADDYMYGEGGRNSREKLAQAKQLKGKNRSSAFLELSQTSSMSREHR